jgi:hypothetical protein
VNIPNVNPSVHGQHYVAWGWVAFAAFLYMIGMATRPIRNYAYQFFYVSHTSRHSLISDPTRITLVHHRWVPRHPPTSTTRLDLGRVHPPLARPYSSYIPNNPISRYPQSPPRCQTHWDGTSSQRRYDASQRPNTARLETGSTYLPPRAQGEYRRTSVHSLQYLETA